MSNKKQTTVEELSIAFRQWQKDWENFDKIGKNKPLSYNDFIKHFLELETKQITEFANEYADAVMGGCLKRAEEYYEEYKYKI